MEKSSQNIVFELPGFFFIVISLQVLSCSQNSFVSRLNQEMLGPAQQKGQSG